MELYCIGCGRTPEQIREYQSYARQEDVTPTEWVQENEPIGVWGKGPNTFYCTECYIAAGLPLRKS